MYVPVATAAMGTPAATNGQRCWHFNLWPQHRKEASAIASITTLVTRQAQASQADLSGTCRSSIQLSTTTRSSPDRSSSNPGKLGGDEKSLAVLYKILQTTSSLAQLCLRFRFCVLVCVVCAAIALLFKESRQPTGPIAAHEED